MALLDQVLDPPVGPGYHSAAQQRTAAGLPASTGTRTWLMLVVSILLGALVTVAAVTLRTPDPAAASGRAELVERIESAQAAGDEEGRRVEELRAEIATLEQGVDDVLDPDGDEIALAGLLAGAQAVSGPGVVVVLDDARDDLVPGEEGSPERVTARDVQLVTNALWGAGAEAVAVNGHRLTATSAIRFAGKAIVVDFRGLTPPYEIRAVGDPGQLDAETTTGFVGAYLGELRSTLGLSASASSEAHITVPAAERLSTRVGTAADRDPATEAPPTQAPTSAPAPEEHR